jgi:hypothetical protein
MNNEYFLFCCHQRSHYVTIPDVTVACLLRIRKIRKATICKKNEKEKRSKRERDRKKYLNKTLLFFEKKTKNPKSLNVGGVVLGILRRNVTGSSSDCPRKMIT